MFTANKYEVEVDSDDRTSGTSSDFTIPINIPHANYKYVALLKCDVPKTFLMVPADTTFKLYETAGAEISEVTITIPKGNYNRISFQFTLQKLLRDFSPGQYDYSVTYPTGFEPDDGRFTYITNAPDAAFELDNPQSSYEVVYDMFGLPRGISEFQNDVLLGRKIMKSDRAVRFVGYNNIQLRSDICGHNGVLRSMNCAGIPAYGIVSYTGAALDLIYKPYAGGNTGTFSFRLTDRKGKILDLENSPFTFTLGFYEEDQVVIALGKNNKLLTDIYDVLTDLSGYIATIEDEKELRSFS